MFSILILISTWKQWYRVLPYRKGFGLFNPVRLGLFGWRVAESDDSSWLE